MTEPLPNQIQQRTIYPLKRLCDVGVALYDCDHRTPKPTKFGYPYIAIPQIQQGRLDLSDVRRISKEDYESWIQRNKPQTGDIIVTRRARVGDTAVIPPGLECAIGQNLVILRSDGTQVDQSFLRWALRGPFYEQEMSKFLNVGAIFDSLNCGDIPKFELPIPPLPVQRRIAQILGTLDDKIELKSKMNETIEAIGKTIFQSWFVEFDPVRARADKKLPQGMDPATAELFPSEFEENEGREVPKGWEVVSLGDIIELGYGKALKQENRLSGKTPVYGSNGQIGWHDEKLVDGPGIIVGRKGNPGIIHWSATEFFPIDTTFFVIPKGKITSLYYLYQELKRQDLSSLGADSAVPGLNRNLVYMSKILVPPSKILEKFDTFMRSLDQKIQNNNNKSRTLATLRDSLLPKLMSGEITPDDKRNSTEVK